MAKIKPDNNFNLMIYKIIGTKFDNVPLFES